MPSSEWWRWVVVAALALLLCDCSRPALSPPSEGATSWHELTSPHFVLQTNVDLEEAQEIVGDFERTYWAMNRVAFNAGQSLEARTHVVVFDGLSDLKPLGYEWADGIFKFDAVGLSDNPPLLLLPGETRDKQGWRELFQHELAHRFVHHHYPSAPAWLNEGLAVYFSTLEVSEQHVEFGTYLTRQSFADVWGWGLTDGVVYALVPRREVPSLERLRELDYPSFYGEGGEGTSPGSDAAEKHRQIHYASAWAAIHALQSLPDGRGRFKRYLDALRGGEAEDVAFSSAFGGLPEAAREAALRAFVARHETDVVRYPLEKPIPVRRADAKPLSAARVQLLLQHVRARPLGEQEESREVERAIELDSNDPETYRARALQLLARKDLPSAQKDVERARNLAPDNPRYLHLAGLALLARWDSGEAPASLASDVGRLVAQQLPRAKTSAQLNLLARLSLEVRGNTGAARQLAGRALKLDATCYRCYETLARAASQREDFDQALADQKRAINLAPHGLTDPQLVVNLKRYELARRKDALP
jgi:Tfp pilus assembly protein PilF